MEILCAVAVTINVGFTSDQDVSITEYHDGSPKLRRASDWFIDHLMKIFNHDVIEVKKFYKSAGLTERKFKGLRNSISYCLDWLDFIFSSEFTETLYEENFKRHCDELFEKDPQLLIDLIKIANVKDRTVLQMESLRDLARFDYFVALALKQFFSKEEIVDMRKIADEMSTMKISKILDELVSNKCNQPDIAEKIMFLQELTPFAIEEIHKLLSNTNYFLVSNPQLTTGIILPTAWKDYISTVDQIPADSTKLFEESLCVTIGNKLLLLSAHLSAKSRQKSEGKLKNYQDQMILLNSFLSSHEVVIGGCDFNHFVSATCSSDENCNSLCAELKYPFTLSSSTCRKERTFMQVQYDKADHRDCGSKDGIFVKGGAFVFNEEPTSSKVVDDSAAVVSSHSTYSACCKCFVGTLNGSYKEEEFPATTASEEMTLPCAFHPYDHFAVVGTIQLSEPIQLVKHNG
jgi:hypothetical protein